MPASTARSGPALSRRTACLITFGVVGLITLAACGPAAPPATVSPVAASPSPSSAPSSSAIPSAVPSLGPSVAPSPSASQAAALLLEVRSGGGFINPSAAIGALPTVVVDAAGRIYFRGAPPDGSSPLIPAVAMRDTGAAGAAAVLAAAKAAGLVDGTGGGGVMADTGVTVFTLEVGGTEVVTRVAGGGPVGRPGGSGAPGAAAMDFLARLTDPTTVWGAGPSAVTTYAPTEYRVWVAPDGVAANGATTAPWPLAADPASYGAPAAASLGVVGLRSGVASGADAVTLVTALATAPSGTDVMASGAAYRVWVEPLLPVAGGG